MANPPPARADFDHAVPRLEIELAADALQLGDRGFLERHLQVLENPTRIHHRGIEKQLKKIIAQVVMRLNVAAAAAARVARHPVQRLLQRHSKSRETRFHTVQYLAVLQQDAHQRRQIIHAPVALHIGLARAYRTTESNLAVETWIKHVQRGA